MLIGLGIFGTFFASYKSENDSAFERSNVDILNNARYYAKIYDER